MLNIHPPFILTRYLYDKRQVIEKLMHTVIQSCITEMLFWVYELYFSGFIEDVIYTAFVIYDKYYKVRYPKLKEFLSKKTRELRVSISRNLNNYHHDTIIGTMYHNLATRIPILKIDEPQTQWKGKNIYTNLSIEKIQPFMTQTPQQCGIPAYQFLKTVCKYSCMTNNTSLDFINSSIQLQMFRDRWEYCAKNTPYWQTIFAKYGIQFEVDILEKSLPIILFDNEENEFAFYKIYGYEPDEQPIHIQQNCLGIWMQFNKSK